MVYFNDIPSFRKLEDFKIIPDERVEKIELMDGVVVQDLGHIAEGDVFKLTCLFSKKNWERFKDLWERREKIAFTDTAGVVWQGMRIVMGTYYPDKEFPQYTFAEFELWRK